MAHVNSAMMVAIDEMSARFRVLELLTRAGQVVATRSEVKKALFRFKFDSNSSELNSTMEGSLAILNEHQFSARYWKPAPEASSFLQSLLVLERDCRMKNKEKFFRLPVLNTRDFTKEMFDAFKPVYTRLYRESIRLVWRSQERSLLSIEAANRTEHRLAMKKKKKKARPQGWEIEDMAEDRRVPSDSFIDPALFWAVGDGGAVKRYKPSLVREKIKTRKGNIDSEDLASLSSTTSNSLPSSVILPRSLNHLKEDDLATRDILWRKAKGLVRWSSVVQFLVRLGCSIFSLDGSKKKVVDNHTGRCLVLHRPHPNEECRRDQLDSYRMQLEDWLLIYYEDLITPEETIDPLSQITNLNLDLGDGKKDTL